MGGWAFPDDVDKEADVTTFDDNFLIYYHDKLHVFWKKIEAGFPAEGSFYWTFQEALKKHTEIINEMGIRELDHIQPINRLDTVKGNLNLPGKGKSAVIEDLKFTPIDNPNVIEVITLKNLSEKLSKKEPKEFISELSVLEKDGKWNLIYKDPTKKKAKGKVIRSFDDKKLAEDFMEAVIVSEILKKKRKDKPYSK